MKTPLKRIIFLITLLVLAAGQAQATTVQKLLAGEGATHDLFGHSVSLTADGGIALIGAYYDDDKGSNSGSAYVFTRATDGHWIQQAKLTAEDGTADDRFGYSVSLSADGDIALIGAESDDDKGYASGSAYVFIRATDGHWIQQAKLTAEDGAINDNFGTSVSLSADGGTALIAAIEDDDKGNNSGSAYVFNCATDGHWIQQAKLTAHDGTVNDRFGYSVSLSADGDIALVGAESNASNKGSAYVFTYATNGSWSQQDKLTAKDGATDNYFGFTVSLSADGDIALIGAYGDKDKGRYSGSAYVFTRVANGSWSQQDKLTAKDGATNDGFGYSVSLSADGGIALIGALGNFGSAYVFSHATDGGWSQQAKLTAEDGAANDYFGWPISLSADGGIALIGASGDHDKGFSSGSAYVFDSACGWGRNLPANTWLMTAPSCQPNPNTLNDQYSSDLGGTGYNSSWISYQWNVGAQGNVEQAGTDPLTLGAGNWNYSFNAGNLTLSGTATPTEPCSNYGTGLTGNCFAINLTPAPDSNTDIWQIVGNPFPYTVTWADVRVASYNGSAWTQYTPSNAASAFLTKKEFWRYSGSAYETYDDNTPGLLGTLRPQESFWVRILSGSAGLAQFKLLIPAR